VEVLDLLHRAGIRYAVLHGVEAIVDGDAASDLDLVVRQPPGTLLPELMPRLHQLDLHPIVRWNYDVGDATTIFLATGDASEGVQLDLLYDVDGVGREGLVTPALLGAAMLQERWPRIQPLHELLYLIRKRHRKKDWRAVDQLVETARAVPYSELELEALRIFRAPVARRVCRVVRDWPGRTTRFPPPVVARRRVARLAHRLRDPVGFWVEVAGPCAAVSADALAKRFGRFLLDAQKGPHPTGRAAANRWLLTTVAPVRWRAGLYVSWASDAQGLSLVAPDLRIEGPVSAVAASSKVVEAMEARLQQLR
jgi:hypothetical protein